MPSHQFLNPPGPYPHPPLYLYCACCMLFPPKTQLCTLTCLFFSTHQALQLFIASHWKCHSRRVSSCRSLPIPTTHLSYNFPNTCLLLSFCPGLGTRPFHTPGLGASRKKDKQGTQQLVLSICPLLPLSLPNICPRF